MTIRLVVVVLTACMFICECRQKSEPERSAGATGDAPEPMEAPREWARRGRDGMVSAAHPLASRAGIRILKAGGNAADAALAVQWALNVVEPQSSGIGGGAFVLYYEARTRRVYALDGRETAPTSARPDMFLDAGGRPLPFRPDRITGGRPVGVPGTPLVMFELYKRFGSGKIELGRTFEDARRLAGRGFRLSPRLAAAVRANRGRILRFDYTRRVFMPAGRVPVAGELFRQPDLEQTLGLLARRGPDVFYRGEIARDIVRSVTQSPVAPAAMSLADLDAYRVKEREALRADWRGYRLYTMPPPASGVVVLQTLKMLERFEPRRLRLDQAEGWHLKFEAEKLAFADREVRVADPDFARLPGDEWLTANFIRSRANLISPRRALPAEPTSAVFAEGRQTTHFTIVDREGNAAVVTSTIENGFGSALMVEGRGFILNNELTDFTPLPGHINSAGPGKRPRSSIAPVLVFQNDQLRLGLGSPGGTYIPGVVLCVLLRALNEGMDIQSAVNAPRALHRRAPGADLESPLMWDAELVRDLKGRGHNILQRPAEHAAFGGVHAVWVDSEGVLWGAADTRREGRALAVTPLD